MAVYRRASSASIFSLRLGESFHDIIRPTYNLKRFSSTTPNPRTSSTEEIIIPKRIPRGPTDILRALAGTVSRDFTAPHYKFHDDPYLIPANNIRKRMYALSKESGKKAARWIFQTYPQDFQNNPAEPTINLFTPKEAYNENSEISEATLEKCIAFNEVTTACTVYQLLLKKNINVSNELKLDFLELLCFYNCTDPTHEDFREEKWFQHSGDPIKRKTWKDGCLAEQLFNKMDPKEPRAYHALIKGMAKFFKVTQAYTLYQEMIDKKIPLDVTTFNYLIPLSFFIKESAPGRWEICQSLLMQMRDLGIAPNLQTFNAVLLLLSKIGGAYYMARSLSLETLGEMKRLGIEPSLATYYHLLNCHCKERGPVGTILRDVMDQLKMNEYEEIRDPYDVFFFVTAMNVCHSHLMDRNIALKINKLLNTGRNYRLIGDSYKESVYYQNFFKILIMTESVDSFFEHYNKFVPNIYSPEPSVMLGILQLIEVYTEWKYIPQIWTDIHSMRLNIHEIIIEKLADILGKNKPEDNKLQEQFASIAWSLKEQMDQDQEDKLRSMLNWSGTLLGNIIQALLNAGHFDRAWEVFQKTKNEQGRITGVINSEVLSNFIDVCIQEKNAARAVFAVTFAASNEILETSSFAKLIRDSMTLTDLQRLQVSNFIVPEDLIGKKNNNENENEINDNEPIKN